MEAAKPLTIAPGGSKLRERLALRDLDGILLASSIGLAVLGVFVLATATADEIAGSPTTSRSGRASTWSSGSA